MRTGLILLSLVAIPSPAPADERSATSPSLRMQFEVVGGDAHRGATETCLATLARLGGVHDPASPVRVAVVLASSRRLVVISRTRGVLRMERRSVFERLERLCADAFHAGALALSQEDPASVASPPSAADVAFQRRSIIVLDRDWAMQGSRPARFLEGEAFFLALGGPDAVEAYDARARLRRGLMATGGVVLGLGVLGGAALSLAAWSADGSQKDAMSLSGAIVFWGSLVGGPVLLIAGGALSRFPLDEAQARAGARARDRRLREELGLPPLQRTPRSERLRPHFTSSFGPRGGGITMTIAF